MEGGHRAIIFSRLGGVKNDTYPEGLHLRLPWFQYPIIYDIRYVHSFFYANVNVVDLETKKQYL